MSEFLKDLINAHAPSGFETNALKVWKKYVQGLGIKVEHDAYGNSWAGVGQGPAVVIVGHADEIGFMVNYIDDKGYIFVDPIGGWDRAIIRGRRVFIHTDNGPVPGVIGSMAIHMQDREGDAKAPKFEQIWIDIGVSSKKEADKLVRVGDPVTMNSPFEMLGKKLFTGKSLDNRIGIYSSAEVLKHLKKKEKQLNVTVYGVAAVQEEIGCYGSHMVANRLKPEIGLAVDVTQSPDHPDVNPRKHGVIKLGGGPGIGRGSANHPEVVRRIEAVAKKSKIPYQVGADARFSGTDGDSIYIANGGTPTAVLSLPLRYMHTPVETGHLDDLENLVQLCAEFCLSIKKGEKFQVKI